MTLSHACPTHRHPLTERGLDLYETPPVATEALLRAEKIPNRVWEPAAGRGAIVRVLRDVSAPGSSPSRTTGASTHRRFWIAAGSRVGA
jgi:hypothetical protein